MLFLVPQAPLQFARLDSGHSFDETSDLPGQLAVGRLARFGQGQAKHIETLIAEGGNITLGAIYPIECAATAADDHNSVAMLVRREGETLNALLKRLDKAIAQFYGDGEPIDEINGT